MSTPDRRDTSADRPDTSADRPDTFAAELSRPLGAVLDPDGRCVFRVWAPNHPALTLRLHGDDGAARDLPMTADERGYHTATVDGVAPGDRYGFVADGTERPDPASRWQPDGVHAPSAVVEAARPDPAPKWGGMPLSAWIIYELHVGTFTAEGTFDAAIARLDGLVALGITAVELMPIAAFPGRRNWGYDGVQPYAAQDSYGGLPGLWRFVDACHAHGIAVLLDVVYNHLGPEGNYLSWYGPYFTDTYRTPWGDALNFDGAHSDEVRAYFVRNALFWLDQGLDGLRLDAVHAIHDESPRSFLADLTAAVDAHGFDRPIAIIAESDQNDPRLITSREHGGIGMAAVWADDLHHALHRALTGETDGYYGDYRELAALVTALRDGFAWQGEYSDYRQRRHGAPCGHLPPERFVVCAQNHDQIGNRMKGERLAALVDRDRLALAAVTVLLSPYTPLLFMGEEHADPAPFPYFIDHGDPDLVAAVQKGRAAEFAAFQRDGEGPPDPASAATFASAVVDFGHRERAPHREVFALYRALIAERRRRRPERAEVQLDGARVHWTEGDRFVALCFGDRSASLQAPPGRWRRVIDTGDKLFGGRDALTRVVIEGDERSVHVAPWHAVVYRALS